jgi:hypothetical protein
MASLGSGCSFLDEVTDPVLGVIEIRITVSAGNQRLL